MHPLEFRLQAVPSARFKSRLKADYNNKARRVRTGGLVVIRSRRVVITGASLPAVPLGAAQSAVSGWWL
jgi:hypothetical protein